METLTDRDMSEYQWRDDSCVRLYEEKDMIDIFSIYIHYLQGKRFEWLLTGVFKREK